MYDSRQKGALLLTLIVTMTIASALGAALLSTFTTSTYTQLNQNSFDQAQFLAASGKRLFIESEIWTGEAKTYTLSGGDEIHIEGGELTCKKLQEVLEAGLSGSHTLGEGELAGGGGGVNITGIAKDTAFESRRTISIEGEGEGGGKIIDCSCTNPSSPDWDSAIWPGTGGFRPIGSSATQFTGTLDGNGYKITNLYINRPEETDVGLFGSAASESQISNVNLEDFDITGKQRVGGLAGYNNGTISDYKCSGSRPGSYSVTVNTTANYSFGQVGGLVGYADSESNISNINLTITHLEHVSVFANTTAKGYDKGAQQAGGLVGHAASGSQISNVNFQNVSVTATATSTQNWDQAGGLAGYNAGTISGCTGTNSTVTGALFETCGQVGGLVGHAGSGSEISNIDLEHFTITGNEQLGGLVGRTRLGSQISDIDLQDIDITGDPTPHSYYIGGLVGLAGGQISDSDGDIDLKNIHVTGDYRVGGLVGQAESGSEINNISIDLQAQNINITCNESHIGGLVGWLEGTITNSSCTNGSLSALCYAGGLAAWVNGGTISNSYSTVSVTATDDYAGGLAAWLLPGTTITNSYSTGSVTGSTTGGCLVESNMGGTITSSYWNTETCSGGSGGGEGKTTEQMKQESTYVDWDFHFPGTWQIDEGVSYPCLQWQGGTGECPVP